MKLFLIYARLSRLTFCFCVVAMGIGCVSSEETSVRENSSLSSKALSKSAQASELSVQANAVAVRRLKRVNELSVNIPPADSVPEESISESDISLPRSFDTQFELWVKGEQWHEVLARTHRRWKECKQESGSLSDECAFVGKARALSYAKLGSIESSLEVYDDFVSMGLKDSSVFFARLLASRGADYLCTKMATIGLSEDSPESREELHTLNVRCLRRSGRGADAGKFLRVAMLEYPKSLPLMLESALNHLSENKLTQGCDLLEQLYNSNFSNVAVLYNWGECLVRRADPDAVKTVLVRGRREWPSEKVWLILAGELARIEGHHEAARQYGLEYLAGAGLSDDLKSKAESLAEM